MLLNLEEGIDETFRVEREQVVYFFADSDKADRQAQFARDGYDYASLGGAIQFGEHDAGHARSFGKFASLLETVLSGGGIEDQQNFVGRIGDHARGGAAHFFQFRHQVGLGLQAAGGIDNYVIGLAGFGCGEGIEHDGAGVRAGVLADDLDAGAFAPDFELFNGCGAECIGGAEQDACGRRL